MKRLFLVFLIVFQALPAFAQFVPHDLLHEMHSSNEVSHQETSHAETHSHNHSHSHVDTSHNTQDQAGDRITNSVFFTHFTDYLHIDLHGPVQPELSSSRHSRGLAYLPGVLTCYNFERILVKEPVRSDYNRSFSYSTPLYKTTRRLLI
ncbi:hypothetical protein MNBD_DELTA01-514 [hydrothermal vent metagenome]|uniref:Uncharacterized protein n=1 Tax=hydrothermal vent metagenome TaxID=652676 RepID=A0A3B0RGG8_9ZZZZ